MKNKTKCIALAAVVLSELALCTVLVSKASKLSKRILKIKFQKIEHPELEKVQSES